MHHALVRSLALVFALGCGASQTEVAEPVDVGEFVEAPPVNVSVPSEPVPDGPAVDAPADVMAPPPHASQSDSGLSWRVLRQGDGPRPQNERTRVTVHYTGWTTDGERFDSSVERGRPATFPLNGVIAGWTEGVMDMNVGEIRRLWIPESLAYAGRPGRPAGMLVFDVQLLSLEEARPAPQTPVDVAAVPSNAQVEASGLASRVLQAGQGSVHPSATSEVEVHYTGWTTDGQMFDSSVTRGRSSTFPLNRVIQGWTEGVQLMVEGESRRFWIPATLAYDGRPGPQGTLVFDIELIRIVP